MVNTGNMVILPRYCCGSISWTNSKVHLYNVKFKCYTMLNCCEQVLHTGCVKIQSHKRDMCLTLLYVKKRIKMAVHQRPPTHTCHNTSIQSQTDGTHSLYAEWRKEYRLNRPASVSSSSPVWPPLPPLALPLSL